MNKLYLTQLRDTLLQLHKALLDCEKDNYEQAHKKIANSAELFALVTQDPWFEWLRELSQLIVSIDELIEAKDTPSDTAIQDLLGYTKKLLSPSPTGNAFDKKYYNALQKSPEAGLLHGKVVELLN